MAFDESEVRNLAALAHLALSEEDVRSTAAHLERLLGYIARLQAIDVTDAKETLPGQPPLPLRADHAEPGLARATVMAGAPAAPLGLFEVPRVVVRSGARPQGAASHGATGSDASDDEVAP